MEELKLRPRREKKQRYLSVVWVGVILFCVMLGFSGMFIYSLFSEEKPNESRVEEHFAGLSRPIFYQNEMLEYEAVGKGASLKLPFAFIKEHIDPMIAYEESTQSVIITTHNKVMRLKTDQLTAMVNEEPLQLYFTVENIDDVLYIPIAPLDEFYRLTIREADDTGAVMIYRQGDLIQWGDVLPIMETRGWQDAELIETDRPIAIRTEPTIKAPIVTDVLPGDRVMMLAEAANGWYEVQLANGYSGFVEKAQIKWADTEMIAIGEYEEAERFIPWKPLGGKINLTWEHVVSRTPSTANIGNMPGLNVISPTWFHLAENSEGELYIKNLATPEYVKWAHERGYQVWALFSNDFDPDLTSKALANYDTRIALIKQLLALADMYNLQGINIDFENVYLKDKDNFTQFVREMTPFLHEQGLVVSIDVTIRGGSEMWSLFADRRELGKVVDYMIVMTYDEHWAASPVAGSVASLPWTEKGIVDIMREDDVPASKLILGVPFYARIWTEEEVDGKVKVSSRAWYMETVQKYIKDNRLEPVYLEDIGQHYVEHREGNQTFKIWIEDEVSMRSRIELVNKHDLAGVASWRRGFETPNIWDVIKETLEKRP